MAQVRLRIVGESVIEVEDRQITPASSQLFAILLVLASERDRRVPRAELIRLLYPTADAPGDSAHRLRQSLYKLRGIGAPIIISGGVVSLEPGTVRSDVSELLCGGWEARRHHVARSFNVLPHYAPPDGTPLGDWVEQLRDQLHNSLRQHLAGDIEMLRRKADWPLLEAVARRLLELDPLNESAVLALAEATARTGSKARAVSILDAYRSELGEDRASLALPASLLQKRISACSERLPGRPEAVPLVGRERELGALLAHWQSARRGAAHLLWLTGNKSVGKSRLAAELVSSTLIGGSGHVVTFSLSPMDAHRPLSLIAALANHLSSLPGAAGCDPSSLRALGTLSGSITIPGTINPDNSNSTYSDLAVRNAICDLIACVTDERPLLVVVDDAQHLDESSVRLLETILGRVADKRLLLTLCGSAGSCPSCDDSSVVRLEPLSPAASQELWSSLIAEHQGRVPDDLSRKCLDAGGGNPGHLELLAQQAVQDPDQFLIPVDLIALTDRRLRQLPLQARYVLEAVVVLGDAATANSVAHLTGLATYDLLSALHTLESSDLVMNTPQGLRCRSGLITERVRATCAGTVATVFEGRAAAYLENEQSGERWSPSVAWRIASHWQRAGEPRRARAYLRACWQHAVSIGQPTRACAAINEALRASSEPEDRASLLDDLIGALQAAGDIKAASTAVRERRLLGARVHDSAARSAQLAFDEDEANWSCNASPAPSVDAFRVHLESSSLNTHRRIRAARILMMVADGDLDRPLASYVIDACRNLAPESSHSALLLRYVHLIHHTVFGDADLALRIADEMQADLTSIERSWYTLTFERNCALARQLVGAGASDYASFERSFSQALDAAMTSVALWIAGSLTSVLIDDGDLAGARRWMRTAEQLAKPLDPSDWPIDYLGAQIDLALLLGDCPRARRYLGIVEKCERYQSKRVRNDLLIYRLRVLQFSGAPWDPEAYLGQLLEHHELGRKLTRHDDHMEVLWQTLTAAGQSERASAMLTDYLLHHRRERRTCRHMLRMRTGSDPAWAAIRPEDSPTRLHHFSRRATLPLTFSRRPSDA